MPQVNITQRVALEARNIIIRKKYREGSTIPQLVKEFELSARHIKVYIIEFNRPPKYKKMDDIRKRLLIQMWEAGESLIAISKVVHIDISKIKYWRKRFGLPSRPTGNPFGNKGRPAHVPHPAH